MHIKQRTTLLLVNLVSSYKILNIMVPMKLLVLHQLHLHLIFQNKVENGSYVQSGLTTAFYSTTASGAIGGVHSLKIFDNGSNIKTLPVVTSVASTTGYGAEFTVESDGIGTILDTQIKFSGIEIPEDKTLTPKAKSQILLTLENNLRLSSVGSY